MAGSERNRHSSFANKCPSAFAGTALDIGAKLRVPMRVGKLRIDPHLHDLDPVFASVLIVAERDEVRHHINNQMRAIGPADVGGVIFDQPTAIPDPATEWPFAIDRAPIVMPLVRATLAGGLVEVGGHAFKLRRREAGRDHFLGDFHHSWPRVLVALHRQQLAKKLAVTTLAHCLIVPWFVRRASMRFFVTRCTRPHAPYSIANARQATRSSTRKKFSAETCAKTFHLIPPCDTLVHLVFVCFTLFPINYLDPA